MFLFIINLLFCGFAAIGVARANLAHSRGTNVVTRTLRDTASNYSYGTVFSLCGALLVIDLIFTLTASGIMTKLAFILPSILMAITFVLMKKSNKSQQRIKDTREVTKGTLQVTEAAGTTVGTAVGAAYGNPMAGKAIGQSVGAIAGAASRNMEDADGIDTAELKTVMNDERTVEALLKRAERVDIETNGRDPEEIADEVVRYASESQLAALPENSTTMEKALAILGRNGE